MNKTEIVYPKTLRNYCPICQGMTVKRLLPKEYQTDPERVSYMCDECVQGINFLKNGWSIKQDYRGPTN